MNCVNCYLSALGCLVERFIAKNLIFICKLILSAPMQHVATLRFSVFVRV